MKRTRLRRAKRNSPTKRLDALLRQAVLLRDGNTCRRCGSGKRDGRGGGLQAAHILPKGAWPAMRYDLDNVLCLCTRCHLFGKGAWHKDPVAAAEWAREHLGPAFLENLRARALAIRRKHDPKLTELSLQLKIRQLEERMP